jgi:hypothetical protein
MLHPFMRTLLEPVWLVALALPLGCGPSRRTAPAETSATPVASAAPAPERDAGPGDAGAASGDGGRAGDAGSEAGVSDAGPLDAGVSDAGDAPDTVDPVRLARDLLRREGTLAYASSTSTFAYLLSHTEEGNGTGLTFHLARAGDEKPFETLTVCEAWECEETRGARTKALVPKVADRLRGKGYVLLTPVRWPEGRGRMTIASPALELRWQRDHLVAARQGEETVSFPAVRHLPQHKPSPAAVWAVPDGAWIAVEVSFDPGSAYGQGLNVYSEVHTYRAP